MIPGDVNVPKCGPSRPKKKVATPVTTAPTAPTAPSLKNMIRSSRRQMQQASSFLVPKGVPGTPLLSFIILGSPRPFDFPTLTVKFHSCDSLPYCLLDSAHFSCVFILCSAFLPAPLPVLFLIFASSVAFLIIFLTTQGTKDKAQKQALIPSLQRAGISSFTCHNLHHRRFLHRNLHRHQRPPLCSASTTAAM